MSDSTTPKPEKPYEGFPLYAHASGRWAKKIRGKTFFFGPWSDPDAALERLNREYPYLSQGKRPPEPDADGPTVATVCNEHLEHQDALLLEKQRSVETFNEHLAAAKAMTATLGRDRLVDDLRPEDFAALRKRLADGVGPVTLRNRIGRVKAVFNYAHKQGRIGSLPRYGAQFDPPTAKQIRLARADAGEKYLDAKQIRALLADANPIMKAMILLGINCGFNARDCSLLTDDYVDLGGSWISYRREKTGERRDCPLWPETVDALRAVLDNRPKANAPADAKRVFLNRRGGTYERKSSRGKVGSCPICCMFNRLLTKLDMNRTGLNFGSLRHTHRTEADAIQDPQAKRRIMGHTAGTGEAVESGYIERIHPERLTAITDRIHDWLFNE